MSAIQAKNLLWIGVVAIAHAFQLGQAATEVANLRRKHKIQPPSTDGPPDFLRALRAQQNCLEFGVCFQIVLWIAGIFCHQIPAALFGCLYLYSRHMYVKGYIQEADKRIPPFWIGIRALKGLSGVALVGIINLGLQQYANIDIVTIISDRFL